MFSGGNIGGDAAADEVETYGAGVVHNPSIVREAGAGVPLSDLGVGRNRSLRWKNKLYARNNAYGGWCYLGQVLR